MQKKPNDERMIPVPLRLPKWARMKLYQAAEKIRNEGDRQMTVSCYVRTLVLDHLSAGDPDPLSPSKQKPKKKSRKKVAKKGRGTKKGDASSDASPSLLIPDSDS